MKKQITCVLVIFLAVGLPISMGNITPTQAQTFGTTYRWVTTLTGEIQGSGLNESGSNRPFNVTITIYGETTTRLLFDMEIQSFMDVTLYYVFPKDREVLQTDNGFIFMSNTSTKIIWGFWIDLPTVSETTGFIVNGPILGFFSYGLNATGQISEILWGLYGPFSFDVLSTTTTVLGEDRGVWLYRTPDGNYSLYYDNSTGVLVKARYFQTIDYSMVNATMTLNYTTELMTESTVSPTSEGGFFEFLPTDSFTIDLLVVPVCFLVFLRLSRRKRERPHQ
ncbi:MAG: hypothetical protein ACFFBD_25995 [Candidatus Hodarchaeota archaeon]